MIRDILTVDGVALGTGECFHTLVPFLATSWSPGSAGAMLVNSFDDLVTYALPLCRLMAPAVHELETVLEWENFIRLNRPVVVGYFVNEEGKKETGYSSCCSITADD